MIYKNFRLNIFIRVFIIVALAFVLAFVFVKEPMFFAMAAVTLILILSVFNLVQYLDKSNKDLIHFLTSLRQGGFTDSFTSGNRGTQYEQLSEAFNKIVSEFGKLNREKELHFQYLHTLNENINVAILSFDAEGKLLLMNPAAKQLLNLPSFSSLDHFKRIDASLYDTIKNLDPEQKKVLKVLIRGDQYQISVQSKVIIPDGNYVRIILLQNLNRELEEKELEAWHQLIRVLTHEIMNSLTPVISLTAAIESILRQPDGARKDFAKMNQENMDDVFSSLSTISSRSKGLLKFVNAYKEYSKPLEAKFESTDVITFVKRIISLLTPELQKLAIDIVLTTPNGSMEAMADVSLMEQALINLIKNAMEVVSHDGTGKIAVGVQSKNDLVSISISDNGSGIDDEVMPRIFIPFFTTKSKGLGIGLSLSRQIMQLHNGTIRVQSSEKGSVFTLEWK